MQVPENLSELFANPAQIKEAFQMLRALKNAHVVKDGTKYPILFSPHNALVDISENQGIVPTSGVSAPTPTPTGNPAIVSGTFGALRNDATACVGFGFNVVNTPKTVYALGRWVVAGNTGITTLSLRDSGGLLLGSCTVDLGAATVGAYVYATLATPVTIINGLRYYVWTSETNGGNQWYDELPIVMANGTADFNSTIASYSFTCSTPSTDLNGRCYGPVNFLYI